MAYRTAGSSNGRFGVYAWAVLGYNLLVILWGAVVRATGSGAGCGEHWPLCQDRLVPHAQQIATLIEFSHRASSGIDVLLVGALVVLAYRQYGSGHPVRRYAAATGFFTLTEGLVGAALVLLGDVGTRVSAGRVAVLSAHLVNTFLLLAALALTAWAAGGDEPMAAATEPPRSRPRPYLLYFAGLLATVAIALSGVIAALADVLYPAKSLAQAVHWDISSNAAPLLHLRIIHPLAAVLLGAYLVAMAGVTLRSGTTANARKMARRLISLVVFQCCLGVVNLLLLTPVLLQVLHLFAADLTWIAMVLLAAESFAGRLLPVPRVQRQLEPVQ